MKDHKENFRSNPTCRLINPSKSEKGKVSKSILDSINSPLRQSLEINQWKNTSSVIKWLNDINNKNSCTFIEFEIKDFYPSVTPEILNNAIQFARQSLNINEESVQIIKHCQKSLLFDDNTPWAKKFTAENFDVTMGSYHGAEICELVGIHILSELSKVANKKAAAYTETTA